MGNTFNHHITRQSEKSKRKLNDVGIQATFQFMREGAGKPEPKLIPVNRAFFDTQLAANGLSLRGLARRMGMSHSQLSLAFSGVRRISLAEAVTMAAIFRQPLELIAFHAGAGVCRQH